MSGGKAAVTGSREALALRSVWCALFVASLALGGCASLPKMRTGMPLEVQRGYWLDRTRFNQRGEEVDKASVMKKFNESENTADNVRAGENFETGSRIAFVPGVLLLAWGITGQVGMSDVSEDTSLKMVLAGSGAMVLSITFGIVAEENYVDAANEYNRRFHSRERRGDHADDAD